MQAQSTNTEDFIKFLGQLRSQIDCSDGRNDTYIILDNHSAHKSDLVRKFIDQDAILFNHRFHLVY